MSSPTQSSEYLRPIGPFGLFRAQYEAAFDRSLRDWADVLRQRARDLQQRAPEDKRFDLGFQWIATSRIEAFAALNQQGNRLATVSVGWWHRVQGMAHRVFTVSDLAPSIGDPSLEFGSLAQCVQSKAWREELWSPKCPVRSQASFVVAEMALVFIFLHEMGHHALGHINASRHMSERRQATWHWLGLWHRKRACKAILKQAEEIEADRFSLSLLMKDGTAFPGQIMPDALKPVLPELSLMAQTLVHLAFGGGALGVSEYDMASHPHPLVRLQASWFSVAQQMGESLRLSVVTPAADAFRVAALEQSSPWTADRLIRLQPTARKWCLVLLDALATKPRSAEWRFDENMLRAPDSNATNGSEATDLA